MKRLAILALSVSLVGATAVAAQPGPGPGGPGCGGPGQPPCTQGGPPPGGQPGGPWTGPHGPKGQPPGQPSGPQGPGAPGAGPPPPPPAAQDGPPKGPRWSRGDRVPPQYRQDQYVVRDWSKQNLTPPPRGYRWLCYQRGNCFLVRTDTGVIRETRWRDEREYYWRQRYSRYYTYDDDIYYRECRSRPDPAGVLIGGLIGGLLGQAAGRDDGPGAAFAGIIIGSIVGGALSRDLDCDDRGYAYRAYYDGLNSGRPGIYRWRNPHNRHRGDFLVRSYYYDNYGFRCANYRHTIWVDRMRRADGRACRQPDGAWAFIN